MPLTSPSPRVPPARHLRLPTEREFTRDQDQLATVLRENPAEILTRDAFLRKRVRTPTLLVTEAFWAWPFGPSRFRFEPVTQNHRRDYERPFFFRETPSFGRSRVLPFRTSCISLALPPTIALLNRVSNCLHSRDSFREPNPHAFWA